MLSLLFTPGWILCPRFLDSQPIEDRGIAVPLGGPFSAECSGRQGGLELAS